MKLIYIAGPYTAETPEGIQENVEAAQQLGREVMSLFPGKVLAVVPHSMGKGLESQEDYAFWCEATIEVMKRCDAVVLVPWWIKSQGAVKEVDVAIRMRLPVIVDSLQLASDLKSAFGGTL